MTDNNKELNKKPVLLPDDRCVICGKTIAEIGGRRIIAQNPRGCTVESKPRNNSPKMPTYTSYSLSPSPLYLIVWGEDFWTEAAIERAKIAFLNGNRAWYCQICGERKCFCGAPMNHTAASDYIEDDGHSFHCGVHVCATGCINPKCRNYRKLKHG